MMAREGLTKIEIRGCVCARVSESALSVVVRGSGEYQTHRSLGLTNSRANTHLALTLKSESSKLSISALRRKRPPD